MTQLEQGIADQEEALRFVIKKVEVTLADPTNDLVDVFLYDQIDMTYHNLFVLKMYRAFGYRVAPYRHDVVLDGPVAV
jgi:hypothetical protein